MFVKKNVHRAFKFEIEYILFRKLTADKCTSKKNFACVRKSIKDKPERQCPEGYFAHKAECLKYESEAKSYASAKVRSYISFSYHILNSHSSIYLFLIFRCIVLPMEDTSLHQKTLQN